MAKFYAVRNGREPGIYSSWAECEAQVKGYSGAIYKSFATEDEAKLFVTPPDQESDLKVNSVDANKKPNVMKPGMSNQHIDIYVDGSYNPATHQYGCGIYMIDRKTHAKSVILANGPCVENGRNVEGEVFASVYGAEHAISNGCKHMTIHHDYEGIAKWAEDKPDHSGKKIWTANKTYTRNYSKHMDFLRKDCTIEFEHVYGHTGDVGNECVDLLAKLACGVDITDKDRDYLKTSIGECTVYDHTNADTSQIFNNVVKMENLSEYAGKFYDDHAFKQIHGESIDCSDTQIDFDSLVF